MNSGERLEGTYGSETITIVLLQAIIHSSMKLFSLDEIHGADIHQLSFYYTE
jgi:hypothetical protein